jgi:hypothetical protein
MDQVIAIGVIRCAPSTINKPDQPMVTRVNAVQVEPMGKFAVIDHAGSTITLSMIKFGPLRRILLRVAKKLRLVERYRFPLFTPKYELAVFDGGRKAVSSLHTPYLVFYYPDAGTAIRKWAELAAAVKQGGLHGNEIIQFIRNGNPREQGLNPVGLNSALSNFFREA